MKWFKFYGQDFLTDSKIGALNPLQKLMWVGLLCVASQDEERTGIIKFLTEDRLKELCGIVELATDDDLEKYNVTFVTFCNMGLVTMPDENTIIITNFHRKQMEKSTSAERVASWRARNKDKSEMNDVTNVMLHETNVMLQSNGRVEKSRIDTNTFSSEKKTLLKLNSKEMQTYDENDFSDSKEKVIDSDTGEALTKKKEIKPEGKNKVALRVQHKFAELCKKNIGTTPILNIVTYKQVLFALNSGELSEEKIYDLFDEWFSLPDKKDEQLVNITQALSTFNINGYKVRNSIK